MTKRCRSCGKRLNDSDRFCDICGTVQFAPSPELESFRKPAESVPKTELETLRASLVAQIDDLEAKLAECMSRQEVDTLHVRLRRLESLLAESVPRREAKAEADSLRAETAKLQDMLAGSVPKGELEAKVGELEIARKTIEDLGGQVSRSSAKIEELQRKLSDAVPRTELETIKNQLQSNIADPEAKLAVSIPRSETEEQRIRTPNASRPVRASSQQTGSPRCPACKYKNRPDAIYCASCGHKLEDEKEGLRLVPQPSTEHSSPVTTVKTAHIGGLSKLKSLLGSGFESQKNVTSHAPSAQSGDLETQFDEAEIPIRIGGAKRDGVSAGDEEASERPLSYVKKHMIHEPDDQQD